MTSPPEKTQTRRATHTRVPSLTNNSLATYSVLGLRWVGPGEGTAVAENLPRRRSRAVEGTARKRAMNTNGAALTELPVISKRKGNHTGTRK